MQRTIKLIGTQQESNLEKTKKIKIYVILKKQVKIIQFLIKFTSIDKGFDLKKFILNI
jgi:hypothetical protein